MTDDELTTHMHGRPKLYVLSYWPAERLRGKNFSI